MKIIRRIKIMLLNMILCFSGLTLWLVVGALNEEAHVAGGSWFELSLGLFFIWTVSSIISETVSGNKALNVCFDMIFSLIAIFFVIKVGKFTISFSTVSMAVKSMKLPVIATLILQIFVAFLTEPIAKSLDNISKSNS